MRLVVYITLAAILASRWPASIWCLLLWLACEVVSRVGLWLDR